MGAGDGLLGSSGSIPEFGAAVGADIGTVVGNDVVVIGWLGQLQ